MIGIKKKIAFAFVEAGLGHIMPMTAVCEAFEKKYGDKAEIVKTYFFQNNENPDLKEVEDSLIKEVKLHNKLRGRGSFQFALMDCFGSKRSIEFLMRKRYRKAFNPALDYMKELDADLIFNTHFATLFYACEAKERGIISSDVVAYCPDPIIGKQWDMRADLMTLSSEAGKQHAKRRFSAPKQLQAVPFLLREQIAEYDKGKTHYRREIGIPEDNFTVLLADGAYGAGKLETTVYRLLKTKQRLTIIAVCGKNEALYQEFLKIVPPENITFKPYGFTDKMLMLAACCDLFVGKAGASNLAEPAYFGVPQIVTLCATPIEKWICTHYTKYVKSAVKVNGAGKAAWLVESWARNPTLMKDYQAACESQHRTDGAEQLADILWQRLNK